MTGRGDLVFPGKCDLRPLPVIGPLGTFRVFCERHTGVTGRVSKCHKFFELKCCMLVNTGVHGRGTSDIL